MTNPLTNGRLNPLKTAPREGSQNMPLNDEKRLANGRILDPIRHLRSRGGWPMIFYEKLNNLNIVEIKYKPPNKWAI